MATFARNSLKAIELAQIDGAVRNSVGFEVPERVLNEPNDTIPRAADSGITFRAADPFFANGFVGDNPSVDAQLDVDLIGFQLFTGDRVSIDIDAVETGSALDSVLRLFDSGGDQLAVSDDTPAPGESFSFDSFIDFTTDVTGSYFVGVSSFANFGYDPFVLGSGTVGATGDYVIAIDVFRPISGRPGNDTVEGLSGRDSIHAGEGDDDIRGGPATTSWRARQGTIRSTVTPATMNLLAAAATIC